jgi:hypothetical protein
VILTAAAWLFGCGTAVASTTAVDPVAAQAATASDPPLSADQIIASVQRALAWYGQARVAMRSLNATTGSIFTRDDEQTAVRILQRAFDSARAAATVLAQHAGPRSGEPAQRRAVDSAAEVERAMQVEKQEIERLQRQLRVAPRREHPALQRELAATANRLALQDARREMHAKFDQLEHVARDVGVDLQHQIQALADAVPELQSGGSSAAPAPVAPANPPSGARAIVQRLVALQRSQRSLDELAEATHQLAQSVETDTNAVTASLKPVAARLRALSVDPTAEGGSLTEGQRRFQELLARAKVVGGILPPLRDEAALLRRYAGDLRGWNQALNRDIKDALESLAVGLVGVLIAIAVILVGATLWRIAARRYVRDPYRYRLVMMARRAVVGVGLALVVVFHFASELTALVTALGFAAAGIAFALQNVILAIAGYFSMMTADAGIRVGDRVSLQGPFGYVQGEVDEIGLVRIRLRELAGDPLRPTGRVVVFPNSVVFTGSFFKHPGTPAPVPTRRPPESQSA